MIAPGTSFSTQACQVVLIRVRIGRSRSFLISIIVLLLSAFYFAYIALSNSLHVASSLDRPIVENHDDASTVDVHYVFQTEKAETVANRQHQNEYHKLQNTNDDDACFPLNSKDWVEGQRLGNSNELDETYAMSVITKSLLLSQSATNIQSILQRSFCTHDSKFTNVSGVSNERLWLTRLVYLSIHAHQHLPALAEYQQRRRSVGNVCRSQLQQYNLGNFDYQCSSAKFLVVRLFKNGIGANMRLAAVPAFMAGLVTNRIVLFVNNAPGGSLEFLQEPWTLSSCHRRDYQCFFLPTTPCVISVNELQQAYLLQKHEMRKIFRYGQGPGGDHGNNRVWIMRLPFRPQRFPDNLRSTLHNMSLSLIKDFASQNEDGKESNDKHLLLSALKAASDRISNEYEMTPSFNYYGAGSPIFHGLLLYALRPNPKSAVLINNVLNQIIPDEFETEHSIGLPIRASDKCGVESECLTFQQHLSAAHELWMTHRPKNNSTMPFAIVTTEAQQIRAEYQRFMIEPNRTNIPFRLYTNHLDVTQDTGFLEEHSNNSTFTADDTMLSAMSSLKAQLMTTVTLGNCCSNFHILLKDLLEEGCGSSSNHHFQCLQEHENPEYRVCCAWDKSIECQKRRNKVTNSSDSQNLPAFQSQF